MVDTEKGTKHAELLLDEKRIEVRKFDDLAPREVAWMYALRYEVFVREQQSIFNEHDGKDFWATHLYIKDVTPQRIDKIVTYARVYKESEGIATLGRVAVDKEYRGLGLGRHIVDKAIKVVKENMPEINTINIAAQTYLQKFYESFGFVPTSKAYDDDGVEHVDMSLKINRSQS